MGNIQPVRCQKCAKPLGYISVFAKGFAGMQQRLENIKVVAVCMDCYRKKLTHSYGRIKNTKLRNPFKGVRSYCSFQGGRIYGEDIAERKQFKLSRTCHYSANADF